MSNPYKNWKEFMINEAGLSRIRQDMSDYDTAFITAFRGDYSDVSMCVYIPPTDEELAEINKRVKNKKERDLPWRYKQTGKINRRNNKELSAYLLSQGYGIKRVQGSYIENFESADPDKVPREVKETSYFVVNLNDDPEFFEQIINLGKKYCQDSVILVPKGEEGYIYGTNNTYPGLDKKETLGKFRGGETGEFMTRIDSRPFVMREDEEMKTYESLPPKQRQAAKLMAKRIGEQIKDMTMLQEADMSAYGDSDSITLYHYAPVDQEEIEIDPLRFGKQSYTRREKQRSSYPRAFYYTNLDQKEIQVAPGKTLYTLNFPKNRLYNFGEDPDGLIKEIKHTVYGYRDDIEWTELFSAIHENYDGAYYSTPNMDLVVLFEPVIAKKVE